jgi:hypothetical protein
MTRALRRATREPFPVQVAGGAGPGTIGGADAPFTLSRIGLEEGESCDVPAAPGAAILVCVAGAARVSGAGGEELVVGPGRAAFVPPGDALRLRGAADCYRIGAPV